MKKLGLGIIGLVLVAAIYYFTAGSAQITEEMKIRVNTELNMLEQNGFSIQEREVKAQKEHFVLSFDDPQKIMKFLKQQGSEIALEDAKSLVGIKIGMDLQYLNDSYSALSVDMYPLNLPDSISTIQDLKKEDKELIKQLNDMLKRKALLVHVDFNKLLSSFKGYIKDIHENFKLETIANIDITGLTFEGTIKNDRINTLIQNMKNLTIKSGDEFNIALNDLQSNYTLTGKSIYDSSYTYKMADLKATAKNDSETFSLAIHNIEGDNKTSVTNDLASNKMIFKMSDLEMVEANKKTKLTHTTFSFNVKNLDMNILKQLEEVDMKDEAETNRLIQALISKGITMEIPSLEVKKMEYLGQTMDGFSLTSLFKVNKSASLAAIQANPFTALEAINAEIKLTLSDALFTIIAQDPRAMMLAMVIQPQIINGKKVYELEIKDGKLTVNGKPMM